jgi:dimethylhistidine N-methyltransferase
MIGLEAAMRTVEADAFVEALLVGLHAKPKRIPPKFFYDDEGSRLFEEICRLPEYYPTRTETALLQQKASDIAELVGAEAELIEFGAGSTDKVRILLQALDGPRAYMPIDISGDYLRAAVAPLRSEYPDLVIRPVVADFTKPFLLPAITPRVRRRVGFFPGSTIGNYEPHEALEFLTRAASLLAGGGLLVGVDLVKDPAILHSAYNDAAGVTAAFNKNVLARANRELGCAFKPACFEHYAAYNPFEQRIEMYLVSAVRQSVSLFGNTIQFAEGEPIVTEYSHKYTLEGFRSLAADAGFVPRNVWADSDGLFSVHWLEAP